MNTIRSVLSILFLFCCLHVLGQQRDLNYIIAADLHFDFLPETDQYYHVLAMNHVPGHFKMSSGEIIRHIDGIVIAGDIFDRSRPEILALYRQRYEQGEGEKTIHFPVYPGLGNHDLDTVTDVENPNTVYHLSLIKNYLDTLLYGRLKRGEILNLHPSSYSYSWNVDDVHFVHAQRYAGDTSYCESNLAWLKDDLQRYASQGNPIVYIQHYGFDDWAIQWWPQAARNALFDLLEQYNVAAFFVGHTHEAMLCKYRGIPIYQVNNAWKDDDGNGSFAVLKISGDSVSVATCRWLDGEGNIETVGPVLERVLPCRVDKAIYYNAFSHNDYWQENPLHDALAFRFNNIEADLWLIDDEIYVGHEKPAPSPEITFEKIYLEPLKERIEQNKGKVYLNSLSPFLLMADFKADGERLYEVLKKKMQPYKKYFCRLENGFYKPGAILFFISGDRPLATLPLEDNRMAFLDGTFSDINKNISTYLMPVISDNYQKYFTWNGRGVIPQEQYSKMKEMVERVHAEDKLFRWWGAPETKEAKQLFKKIKVDLIGTDDLNLLHNILME